MTAKMPVYSIGSRKPVGEKSLAPAECSLEYRLEIGREQWRTLRDTSLRWIRRGLLKDSALRSHGDFPIHSQRATAGRPYMRTTNGDVAAFTT